MRGGAAGRGRMYGIDSAAEITCFCLQHIDTGIGSYRHKLSWHLFGFLLLWCFVLLIHSRAVHTCAIALSLSRTLTTDPSLIVVGIGKHPDRSAAR